MPTDGHTRKQPTAPTLTTSNTTTEDHAAATQAPLDAIIVAKQKPTPRLSKPRGEDAAIDGEDAIILQSLSRSRLRDDAPKEEKDAKTPPSPDPADLRFPSGAQAVGRRSTSTTTLPRKITAPAGAAVAGSGEDRSKDFSRRCADQLPPPTAAHKPPPCRGRPHSGHGIPRSTATRLAPPPGRSRHHHTRGRRPGAPAHPQASHGRTLQQPTAAPHSATANSRHLAGKIADLSSGAAAPASSAPHFCPSAPHRASTSHIHHGPETASPRSQGQGARHTDHHLRCTGAQIRPSRPRSRPATQPHAAAPNRRSRTPQPLRNRHPSSPDADPGMSPMDLGGTRAAEPPPSDGAPSRNGTGPDRGRPDPPDAATPQPPRSAATGCNDPEQATSKTSATSSPARARPPAGGRTCPAAAGSARASPGGGHQRRRGWEGMRGGSWWYGCGRRPCRPWGGSDARAVSVNKLPTEEKTTTAPYHATEHSTVRRGWICPSLPAPVFTVPISNRKKRKNLK